MLARPIEHQIDIDRRELAKRDEGWAQEREREAARAPAATSQADWSGWEAWLAARLATERAFVLECVGTALGQALQKERAAARRELADEIRRLRVEITAADETIAELRRTIAASRSSSAEVIDITPVRRAN